MEKRLIAAIALSILIIVAFQYLVVKPGQIKMVEKAQEVATTPVEPIQNAEISVKSSSENIEEKEFVAETDKYILTFSNVGGAIKKVQLKEHKNPNSSEPLELIFLTDPKEYLGSINSLNFKTLLDSNPYKVNITNDTVTCSLNTDEVSVVKKYDLHKSKYGIDLQIIITNKSEGIKQFSYRIIGGAGLTESNAQDKRLLEVTSNIEGKQHKFKNPKNGRIVNPGLVSWSALKGKYFSIVLKPFANTKDEFYQENKMGGLVMGVDTAPVTLGSGASIDNKFAIYIGPSDIGILKEFGYGLEETINYGFFGGISKGMIAVMKFFYTLVHSWGVAIILLAIFLNIILFPLTVKSFKSMQKMQELHPQMEKLKVQLKDNPQKLNKEIMELYKKYKINPFSGCLPMILQMPVFIALYQALMKSIELRCANFLWIKDLSMPDAVKLPVTLPVIGNSINILPLFMVAAMVIQQKISTKTMGGAVSEEQRQQQKMMLIVMPIVFGFIFYNMPSGLVLYWVVNTVLTIVEQSAVLKKSE